ncbi:hypothetical protein [uncultured Ilyobacter sp.]|uniref:hypothetical protein n=1 Tax=uncultured Ilyobacter sp. TaxID=544433 RepID=UPI0029BFF92E|nr:hypothetical protein [uncultured Ilyobacter sp.]
MITFDIQKPYKKKLEKGSAIILSVLMLAFFTVMTLNIYYFGGKKAESVRDKVLGEKITNYLDIASSIGYQELYIAESFVRKGVVYDNDSHPAKNYTYTQPTDDDSYSYLNSDGTYSKKYSGIQLTRFSRYFDSHWEYDLDDEDGNSTEDSQKLIMTETIDDGKVENRTWQSGGVPTKIFELWEATGSEDEEMLVSIGGYRLKEVYLTDDTSNTEFDGADIITGKDFKGSIEGKLKSDKSDSGGDNNYLMKAIFEKTIKIDEFKLDDEVQIPEIELTIQASEVIEFNTDDGTDLSSEASFDEGQIYMNIIKLN